MQKLIECVPNFSEGRDADVIRHITDAIDSVDGVSLLDVDPGATTNRTVVTFVGNPEAVVEGAFRGIAKAAQLIDMRKHKGAHPRLEFAEWYEQGALGMNLVVLVLFADIHEHGAGLHAALTFLRGDFFHAEQDT